MPTEAQYRQHPWMPDDYETYVMFSDEHDFTGFVTNALTGHTVGTLRSGIKVVVNEHLCSSCDEPISDGPCSCITGDGEVVMPNRLHRPPTLDDIAKLDVSEAKRIVEVG